VKARKEMSTPSTKTTDFEVKNMRKSAEEAKAEHFTVVILFYLEDNKPHLALETNSTKL